MAFFVGDGDSKGIDNYQSSKYHVSEHVYVASFVLAQIIMNYCTKPSQVFALTQNVKANYLGQSSLIFLNHKTDVGSGLCLSGISAIVL